MTRAGAVYIGMTLLMGLAAVNTGNNLLYLMVSALLGFMAVSGLIGKRNLEGLTLHLMWPAEVYAGQSTLVTVQVKNARRWLDTFLLEVDLGDATGVLPLVGCRQHSELHISYTFDRRGRYRLGEVTLRSAFPIHFFVRHRRIGIEQAVVVFPRPNPCLAPESSLQKRSHKGHSLSQRGHHGELYQIRDYHSGESLRRIHWKLSARHDDLKVKELSAEAVPPLELEIGPASAAGLEAQLSCAAYWVVQAIKESQAVGLRLAGRRIAPACSQRHKRKLLTALALYGQD